MDFCHPHWYVIEEGAAGVLGRVRFGELAAAVLDRDGASGTGWAHHHHLHPSPPLPPRPSP